jgi:branched-chain amino acid transport system substrate-binding protein
MKIRLLAVGAVLAAAIATAIAATSASGGGNAGTILIGISTAKTGILAPYDLQASQLFQMRIEQINKAGGVLGQKLKVEWLDTKSDKPTAATNAEELIGKGAKVIIATCDFDFSFPAINAAHQHKIPGIALCASSPKVATPAIVGPYGGSMGLGSDTEGSAAAEWLRRAHPSWKRAYVMKDTSLEYSKATADYFKADWLRLGGKVCGEDTFVGGPNLDLSSQTTRLRGAIKGCDVIFNGSWEPFASQFARAVRSAGINTPIMANAAGNGVLVRQVAGKISNYYAEAFVCLPTYCTGTQTPLIKTVSAQFKARWGKPIGDAYNTRGYDLANAVVAAIKAAGSTDGTKITNALFGTGSGHGVVLDTLAGKEAFTAKCHRPQPAAYSIEQFTNGVNKQIDTQAAHFVPNIGDGSPCSGKPPALPK